MLRPCSSFSSSCVCKGLPDKGIYSATASVQIHSRISYTNGRSEGITRNLCPKGDNAACTASALDICSDGGAPMRLVRWQNGVGGEEGNWARWAGSQSVGVSWSDPGTWGDAQVPRWTDTASTAALDSPTPGGLSALGRARPSGRLFWLQGYDWAATCARPTPPQL